MTLILIIVVSVFFCCQIPDLTLRVVMTLVKLGAIRIRNLRPLRYVNAATNCLLTINSSANFLIYCLIGKKFRRILLRMCGCTRVSSGGHGGGGGGGVTAVSQVTRGACSTTAGGVRGNYTGLPTDRCIANCPVDV